MSAKQIVTIQLRELKKNDINDSGIQAAYFFASPQNKQSTGPFEKFKNMVKNNIYKHLINHKMYRIISEKFENNKYYFEVLLLSRYDNKYHKYLFILTRKNMYDSYSNLYLRNYFRTDAVLKIN